MNLTVVNAAKAKGTRMPAGPTKRMGKRLYKTYGLAVQSLLAQELKGTGELTVRHGE